MTLANVLLAIFTGLLPLGMLIGLIKSYKTKALKIDQISILATSQWLVILMIWELIPFRMWL